MNRFIVIGYILITLALCFVSYQQGVIDERRKWQKIYKCTFDKTTGAQVCIEEGHVNVWSPTK